MLVLMIGLRKTSKTPWWAEGSARRGHHKLRRLAGVTVQTHRGIRVMAKKRKQPSEPSIFDDNPFLDGFFEWMDSPEGERAQEVLDSLLDLMADVEVDPKQRKLVWPDVGPLDLQQSIEHIQKQCPEFSVEEIEGHLLYWIESGYGPDNCSQQQLEELERLSLQWVADHTRAA